MEVIVTERALTEDELYNSGVMKVFLKKTSDVVVVSPLSAELCDVKG